MPEDVGSLLLPDPDPFSTDRMIPSKESDSCVVAVSL